MLLVRCIKNFIEMDKTNHDVLIFEWFSPSLQNGGGGIGREYRGGNSERPPPSSCFFLPFTFTVMLLNFHPRTDAFK